jgi:hypothetical protein
MLVSNLKLTDCIMRGIMLLTLPLPPLAHLHHLCRFCSSTLADWKASLTPEALKPEVQHVQPIMVVYFEGEIHR